MFYIWRCALRTRRRRAVRSSPSREDIHWLWNRSFRFHGCRSIGGRSDDRIAPMNDNARAATRGRSSEAELMLTDDNIIPGTCGARDTHATAIDPLAELSTASTGVLSTPPDSVHPEAHLHDVTCTNRARALPVARCRCGCVFAPRRKNQKHCSRQCGSQFRAAASRSRAAASSQRVIDALRQEVGRLRELLYVTQEQAEGQAQAQHQHIGEAPATAQVQGSAPASGAGAGPSAGTGSGTETGTEAGTGGAQ